MPQSSLVGWLSKPAPIPPTPKSRLGDERLQLPKPSTRADGHPGKDSESGALASVTSDLNFQGLPSNVELRECRKEDIKSFKRLNSLLLPIPYADAFYREIMEDTVTSRLTLMALWHETSDPSAGKGILVGAIRCRLLADLPSGAPVTPRKEGPILYLSTLVLLSPYRGYGIAAKMLDTMTRRAVNDYGVASVGAHVWEANEEGLTWYSKRGFREVRREPGYYRRLDPQGAVVVLKDVSVMDLLET